MKKNFIKIFLVALGVMFCCGCYKPVTYPDYPIIQFVSLTSQTGVLDPYSGLDSTTIITISFTDGNGLIGYNSGGNGAIFDSTSSPYYNDFIVTMFQKVNGVWTQYIPPPGAGLSGRIPPLTPSGTDKALSGTISMTQYLEFITTPQLNDTIYYQVYIYDRALQKSNTITTSQIVISTVLH